LNTKRTTLVLAALLWAIALWVEPTGARGDQIFVSNGGNGGPGAGSGSIGEYDATTGATVNAALVSGLNGGAAGIAVSGGNLFVVGSGDGTIGKYNATTGATVNATLISGLNQPSRIAVSGGNLYVGNNLGTTIGEYNAATGATVNAALVSAFDPLSGIAVSGSNLFVTINTKVSEYNATTGATVNASLITAPNLIYGIAASGSNLFLVFANQGTIGEYTTSGATVNSTLVSGLNQPGAIAVFGGNLFVSNLGAGTIGEYNATTGAIVNAALVSTAAFGIAVVPEPSSLLLAALGFAGLAAWGWRRHSTRVVAAKATISLLLTVAATIALWVEPTGARGQIYVTNFNDGTMGEYTTSGATVNANLISGLNGPVSIAISGANVFVLNYGTYINGNYNPASGSIGEYTTSGATVNAALITGLQSPQGIAVSGSNLFVTNFDAGTIGKYTTSGATANAALVSDLYNPYCIAASGPNLFVRTGIISIGEYNATTGAMVNANLIPGLNGVPVGIAISGANMFVLSKIDAGGCTLGEYTTSGATVNTSLIGPLDGSTSAIAVVPEPATFVLAAVGFAGLAAWGWRRSNRPYFDIGRQIQANIA
jgi:hypothetical protein